MHSNPRSQGDQSSQDTAREALPWAKDSILTPASYCRSESSVWLWSKTSSLLATLPPYNSIRWKETGWSQAPWEQGMTIILHLQCLLHVGVSKYPLLLNECWDTEHFVQSYSPGLSTQYLILFFFQNFALEWIGNEPSSHPQISKTEDTQFRACL